MDSFSLCILLSLVATVYLLPISQVTVQDEAFATVGILSVSVIYVDSFYLYDNISPNLYVVHNYKCFILYYIKKAILYC